MFLGIEQYLVHILVEKWLLRITLREVRSSEEKEWKSQILIKILKEKERDRIRKIREMQKLERMFYSGKKEAYCLKEKIRNQEQRKKKVNTLTKKKNEKLNVQRKRKCREERQKLQLTVKFFSNENRKLKRKVQSLEQVSDDKESESESE